MRVFIALLFIAVTVVQGQYGHTRFPPRDVCRNRGNIGTCLGFANPPCPSGTTCTPIPNSDGGLCCIDRPNRRCRGSCGGFVGPCREPGYECINIPGTPIGNCCRRQSNGGQCPPASPRAGICVFRPGYNCLSNNECRRGQICCPEGCGKVCKYPTRGPYPY